MIEKRGEKKKKLLNIKIMLRKPLLLPKIWGTIFGSFDVS